ncbi:hypothetical protein SLA2020_091200 [Shorea laevis]
MCSGIGTGSLAYRVGSKVMDMRSSSKDEGQRETIVKSRLSSIDNTDNIENSCDLSNNCTDMSRAGQREISSDPTNLVTLRVSTDGATRDSSFKPTPGPYSSSSSIVGREYHRPHFITETYIDFPPLSVIDLVDSGVDENDFVHMRMREQQMRLWNMHQLVVDVVRTDSHLEVYKDPRNLERISDILAVSTWVDPATGYCQGMSDLLSPFVVLFEDSADAWCFEMLISRLCENFQMEGPS